MFDIPSSCCWFLEAVSALLSKHPAYCNGVLSYWRGNGANITRYIPLQALNFSFYNMYYDIFASYCCADLAKTFGAGALAGLSSITVVFPLDFCTTRLAVDIGSDHGTNSPKREFYGLRHCLSSVIKTDGVLGLYKGYTASAVGLTIYRSVYFGLYESYKQKFSRSYFQESKWEGSSYVAFQMLVAQVVTTIAAWVSYPFDTAGRRMMLEASKPQEYRQIKNINDSFLLIYKNEGIYGFYKGALANIMRSSGSALVLVLYDEILYHSPLRDIAADKKYQRMQKNLLSCK
ncbi:ADP/ATP translocase 4-like isoform X2 [Agrilus planipennis]|uniref:ADP/ATP translocase n=1 Tax=Agrilus planipennis TaxID=224129 RepID=A0A7F5R338_AGRPL|nr:ADP/ATP translocase 4-like isoform X2 [Agrilus planipennis]